MAALVCGNNLKWMLGSNVQNYFNFWFCVKIIYTRCIKYKWYKELGQYWSYKNYVIFTVTVIWHVQFFRGPLISQNDRSSQSRSLVQGSVV